MSTEGALKDAGKPVTGPFEKTKGWLDWYEGPSKPKLCASARRRRRALPCVWTRRRVPLCA